MNIRKWMTVTALIVIVGLIYVIKSQSSATGDYPAVDAAAMDVSVVDDDGLPHYAETLKTGMEQSARPYAGAPVEIDPAAYVKASANAEVRVSEDGELGRNVLEWSNGAGWVEWSVELPADGSYELEATYLPTRADSSSSVFYGLSIDGRSPFSEAKNLEFVKGWRDKDVPYKKDKLGNEIRSVQEQVVGWETSRLTDYAVSSTPLLFHLAKGRHTLRFEARNEPMNWGAIRLIAPETIPGYKTYSDANAGKGSDGSGSWHTVIEGERYTRKSHPSVQTGTQNEPHVSPDGKGRLVYNILDGLRWKRAGEWAEWSFEAPSDGMYEIDIKEFQRFAGKANVYRTLLIDGEVPFAEMLHVPFPSNNKLELHTLADPAGKPYLFRLAKGKHTLRLVTDLSPLNAALLSLQGTIQQLHGMEQKLRKLTGDYGANSGDANRTWDIAAYYPDLGERLGAIRDQLKLVMNDLNGLNRNETDASQSLKIGVAILDDLLGDIDQIPNKLGKFPDLQMRIGAWMDTLTNGGLSIDFIVVRGASADVSFPEASALNKIPYAIANFARTFYLNYNARATNDRQALEVWVGRGRDYASLLQEMIDQSFTPQTGIAVNVNFMPDANALTLSNAGGDQPDVALGLAQDMPVDYAMRDASVDLTGFPGFAKAAARFNPGVMRSFGYGKGIYALPETQSYPLLFYRKSVLKELGFGVPDTWDDVQKLLPALQENGMQFYYNAKDFVPFFYQRNAELYTPDGLAPAFDTEAAYKAFDLWTGLFAKYDLPQDVPAFFQHFKLGTMPIGVADFNTYIQLLTSAPEIRGDWAIAPMTGLLQPDGTVARWAMNTMTAAMILKKSDKREQAWTFIDWWTSDDVQLQYGNAMESFYGSEYRWNTANMKAMSLMPWPAADLAAIREQNRWTRNVPYLPGGYLLAREMEFAWNRTVVGKMPPKDSLDRSFVEMQRETARKQRDLGISADGLDLAFPAVNRPFDWGTLQ